MRIVIFLLLMSFFNYLNAQDKDTDHRKHQRFAIQTGLGATYGFNSFTQEFPQNAKLSEQWKISHNMGLGLTIFHKSRWISSYQYYKHNPYYGAKLQRVRTDGTLTRGTYTLNSGDYNGLTLQIGRRKMLKESRWQFSWLAGVNLEYIVRRNSAIVNFNETRMFKLEKEDPIYEEGLSPSLQAGYQVAFRGKRMGLSLSAIGNLGLRYYLSRNYTAWVDYVPYEASIRSKGDLVAAILRYEVYLGKSRM